ncbi:ATP-binding protein [Methylomagnum sp.]
MRSLRNRLNTGLVTILIVVFGSLWALGSYAIHRVVENEMLTRLEHDGDSLLASLRVDPAGNVRFDPYRLGLIYEEAFSGHYFVIHADGQVFRSKSLGDHQIASQPLVPGQRFSYHCAGPQGQPLLVLTRGIAIGGESVTLAAAEELTVIEHEIHQLSIGYLILIASVLVISILLQSLDVARALRPLAAIRRQLLGLSRGELSRIDFAAPTEIRPLVDELNRVLTLMDHRLRQSRTAVGNLAHALKTPLAMLFRIADDASLRENPELARQLKEQTEAIHRRIERELKRARLSGAGSVGSLFNPSVELAVLVRVLENVYPDKGLRIDVSAPDAWIPYDREDLLELIGILADNACKWAASRVAIRFQCDDGITLSVADDGPGCPHGHIEQLARRGVRLDESVPGHGLGLAIARDIAEFYEGTLEIQHSPELGGLEVNVVLPTGTGLDQKGESSKPGRFHFFGGRKH